MVNVYESVDSNIRKSWLIIIGFASFIFLSAYLIARGIGAYYGYETTGFEFTGIALVISGISSFVSYYFSDRIILTLSGARPADKRTDFQFYTVAENLCLAAGLPLPKLYVIDDTALNAFATKSNATIGIILNILMGLVIYECLSYLRNFCREFFEYFRSHISLNFRLENCSI